MKICATFHVNNCSKFVNTKSCKIILQKYNKKYRNTFFTHKNGFQSIMVRNAFLEAYFQNFFQKSQNGHL